MKEHQNLFRDLQEDFRKMKKNLLVAQSGGPTAAINATLAGVIKQAIKEEQIDQVYGACYGIQGVLEQKFVNLTEKVDTEEKIRYNAVNCVFSPFRAVFPVRHSVAPANRMPSYVACVSQVVCVSFAVCASSRSSSSSSAASSVSRLPPGGMSSATRQSASEHDT